MPVSSSELVQLLCRQAVQVSQEVGGLKDRKAVTKEDGIGTHHGVCRY